ncbi:MAG: DUF2809 domain-containing protein [Bacteroidota bacterium]
MKLTFNKKYFFLTCFLFLTEVLIALYVHDQVIRPYIGDVLVVILIYCFVRTFFNVPVFPVAIGVLAFACLIETMQYFKLVNLLGLQKSKLANTVIGNSFSWGDILAYIAGIAIVLAVESYGKNRLAAK